MTIYRSINALMECLIGLYKAECIGTTIFHEGPYKTLAEVEFATSGWGFRKFKVREEDVDLPPIFSSVRLDQQKPMNHLRPQT